jgi:hypothetical protein
MQDSAGADHVIVFVEKSSEGVRYRIELQEGVLRAIGQAAQAAQAAKARSQAGF